MLTGWWFQTFFIFHNIWDNPSHWLSYFSRWLKPPTSWGPIWEMMADVFCGYDGTVGFLCRCCDLSSGSRVRPMLLHNGQDDKILLRHHWIYSKLPPSTRSNPFGSFRCWWMLVVLSWGMFGRRMLVLALSIFTILDHWCFSFMLRFEVLEKYKKALWRNIDMGSTFWH